MRALLTRTALIGLALHFLSVAAIILSRSYIDLLFLSTYPQSWLPYLFMGQTGVSLLLALVLGPMISRGSRVMVAGALIAGATVVVLAWLYLPETLPFAPFALCLFLAALATLLGVVSWNAVGDAFDIRQFKVLAKWFGVAGSVGALLLGMAMPVVVGALSTNALLPLLAGLVLVAAVLVARLTGKAPKAGASEGPSGRSPWRYGLFVWLATSALLLLLVDTVADYILKTELAAAYDREGIASFMGPFYGLSSGLALLVQLAVTDRILKRFGVFGLLVSVPLVCVAGFGAVAASPSLWVAAALRLFEGVAYYGLFNVGQEIAAAPLPAAVRRRAKLLLKAAVIPAGMGLAAVTLWLTAEPLGLRGLALLSFGLSAAWIVVVRATGGAYKGSLEEAVRSRRFGLGGADLAEGATDLVGRDVAYRALKGNDPEEVLFGLHLLRSLEATALPSAALSHLASQDAALRCAVARAAKDVGDRSAAPALVKRLGVEEDQEVRWALLEALATLDPMAALPVAEQLLGDDEPQVRAGAVLVLLQAGDLDGLIASASALREMLTDGRAAMRAGAARAIGQLRMGRLEKELGLLLGDSDEEVALAAAQAAGARKVASLAPDLCRRLGPGRLGRQVSLALVQIGPAAVASLVHVTRGGGYGAARAAIRTLARIEGPEATESLLSAAKSDSGLLLTVTVAREAAQRIRRGGQDRALSTGARDLVLRQVQTLQALSTAMACPKLHPPVAREVAVRLRLVLDQYLHWLAAATDADAVVEVVPSFVGAGATDLARRAAATELLDALVKDTALRGSLACLDGPAAEVDLSRARQALLSLDEPFLKNLLAHKTIGLCREGADLMETADKAMLLRRVELFEALPGEVLLEIAQVCKPREVTEGEVLFKRGEAPTALYVVASGKVEIGRGKEVLAKLSRPAYFGELGLLDDSPRVGRALVTEDGVLLEMGKEDFDRLTEDLPEVLRAVIRKLAEYVRSGGQQSETLTSRPPDR